MDVSPLQEKNMNTPPSKSQKSRKRLSVERIYQKKTQLEHILLRPDAYIGSVEPTKQQMWIWNEAKQCMVNREINFVPGLYKIFDEILVNAADNKQRDPKMNYIKIGIDVENNVITVQNNGRGIPVEMHKEEKLYVPSMIFGHLLTSSNYDDTQKKVTGGRNGYGAKLCNIYSKEFSVETVCDGRHFKQTWRQNMTKTKEPKIQDANRSDFTSIKFEPDLEKFKMEKLDQDMVDLMTKRAYDLAGCCRGVVVYVNGKKLPVRNFQDYIKLYLKDSSDDDSDNEGEKKKIVYQVVNKRWEVAVTVSHKGFQQASFVNGIATTKGGTHVNHVVDQVIEKLVGVIKKKSGKGSVAIKPFQIKNHLWVFINCLIENPAFDSQTKENMTLRAKAFGSECGLDEKFVKEVTQCGVVENILDWVRLKTQSQLKKCSGSKNSRLKGIPKLDDANDAGSKFSIECTLILTEGDSAKTLAVSGLSVVGRDRYGVFPLRGKLLNVREASHKQLTENAEINNIVKILGLQYGKKYRTMDDLKALRYGRLMIMTDQDQDGSHIKGLLINFIHHNWPDLLKLPFLEEFITPIVKASKGGEEIAFYSIPEFEEWKESCSNLKSWKIKYYKGLGTSTPKEAKEYFADMERHRILFDYSGITDDEAISLAFSKKKVNDRKVWLTNQLEERKVRREAGLPEIYLYGPGTRSISYTDFVNKELILFSNADNERSIPSLVDGLKPGQRKVLFTCFKRNDKREVKVAQLSGSVAELSAYHHGEQSLASTIINLAQNYVGSNNLSLLMPIGQFGTRIHGGKDSASPRYIFTKLSPLARLVFPLHDDHVLNFLVEDNQMIEPEWYCPILPMVLVNGADGIGTGYSTKIPNYDVRQLVQYIKDMIMDNEPQQLQPSYKSFTGEIRRVAAQKFEVLGKIEVLDEKTIEITELPIGTWTQNYKESVLEVMLHGTEKYKACIADYKEYHTDTTVHFIVQMNEQELTAAENTGLYKKFNLTSSLHNTNMVLFDSFGAMKKYETVHDIIKDFYDVRLKLYRKRKEFLEGMLQAESEMLSNKARFILEKCDNTIVIENKAKRDVIMNLVQRGYGTDPVKEWKDLQTKASVLPEESDTDDSASETSSTTSTSGGPDFGYLLSMAMMSLTKEKKEELLRQRDEKIAELKVLRDKTTKDLWFEDLEAFLAELEIFEAQEREDAAAGAKITNKNKSGKSRSRRGVVAKNTIEKAFKKQQTKKTAEKKPAVVVEEEKRSKEKRNVQDDLGFSEDSENTEMLSLSERLALKKYEDTSDGAVSSVSGSSKSSKTPLLISGGGQKKAGTSLEKIIEIEDSDSSSDSVPFSKKKTTSAKESSSSSSSGSSKVAPAKTTKRGKKTTSVAAGKSNTIEKAFKVQAERSRVLEDTDDEEDDVSWNKKKPKPSKRATAIDSDSSESSTSSKTTKSKPPTKKPRMLTEASPMKKRAKVIASSGSSEDEEREETTGSKHVSPVKRSNRRQKAPVKYVDDDEESGNDSWMVDDDSDGDSDFE